MPENYIDQTREEKLNSKIINKTIVSFKSLVYLVEKKYDIYVIPGTVTKLKKFIYRSKQDCHDNPYYTFCMDIMGYDTRQLALFNIAQFLKSSDSVFTAENKQQSSNDKIIPYLGKFITQKEGSCDNENNT